MDWRETALSLQLLAEERVGFVMRERMRIAKAREDQVAAGVMAALRGPDG